ncbi:UDP-4-amino-4,6-dideoxy-N-acetyl-beta-L-altrosamine N-acetyltransferase [Paenibacillus tritici]|uniref:UDP-4-amino-4, 6-dideoxy-N-acetyl-beta-L-altrosamine N-acetyltransferase n=1 Tax=Paenibacillus tritici TaxID=1873425 RepID=A0ABX2DJ12_9BACL|nr:UDP-4-amino-4,6-dideoxy-N-acetyl-beta-L-altrosamine N-acetyltransferase [Paenibacillus tritici]NQX44480.1 UDP-4-amino-4,6-dideoxy-N-acetyl-beta-L-altrosamine N-acetyltransferase [Paenibacillus tritici]
MADIHDYTLKELSREHSTLIWEWRNAAHVRPFMNHDGLIPLEEHHKWLNSIAKDASRLVRICYYQAKPIGFVQFSQINLEHQTCEWGFYIGNQDCPRRSGTIMGILALELIFQERQMRKVCAEILDFNQKSLSYHRKLGFVEEGRLVRQRLRNHQPVDVVLMGLFREQWKKQRVRLKEEVANANEGNNHR